MKDDDFGITWDGREITSLDDEMTEEEKRQFEEDCLLDVRLPKIPNWSKHYKTDD